MTSIFLSDGLGLPTDDTTSSAFPDYSHDTIWVGGALGWLHKITGGFAGTRPKSGPAASPSKSTPATLPLLSSPVYDRTSTNVFVGDYGGFLYLVSSRSRHQIRKDRFRRRSGCRPCLGLDRRESLRFFLQRWQHVLHGDLSLVPLCTCSLLISRPATPVRSEGWKQPGRSPQSQSTLRRQLRQHLPCFRECHRKSLRLRKYRRTSNHVSASYYGRRHGHCRCRAAIGQYHDWLLARDRHS